jgi:hypothetical protein
MSTVRSHVPAALLLSAGLALTACGPAAQGADELPEVAAVEPAADGGPGVLTLSEAAESRLGIETGQVTIGPSGLEIPYSALVYAADGSTWVFVQTDERTYQRAAVSVAAKNGDAMSIRSGPSAGTAVVTVGAAELVGVEIGIDGEE